MCRTYIIYILILLCLISCQQHQLPKNNFYKYVDTKTNAVKEQVFTAAIRPKARSVIVKSLVELEPSEEGRENLRVKTTLIEKQDKYMTVTAYCPCAKCCGWKMNRYGNPVYNYGPKRGHSKKIGMTSTGSRADIGTIAADVRSVPYGTRIYIHGYGYGEVKDTGGLLKGNHIDLFFHSHSDAIEWGMKYLKVAVWPPE